MPTFSVTITNNTTPAISVGLSNNTTYQQLKNSLGNFVYKVDQTYVFSTLLEQIQGGFLYSKYDSGGNQNLQTIISAISPYQSQNSIYLNLSEKNVVIDGRDFVRFRMYPNSNLQVKLYCFRIALTDYLDKFAKNNFKKYEDSSGNINFFEQYVDVL